MKDYAGRLREMQDKYETAMHERSELEEARHHADELKLRLEKEITLEQEQRKKLVSPFLSYLHSTNNIPF